MEKCSCQRKERINVNLRVCDITLNLFITFLHLWQFSKEGIKILFVGNITVIRYFQFDAAVPKNLPRLETMFMSMFYANLMRWLNIHILDCGHVIGGSSDS